MSEMIQVPCAGCGNMIVKPASAVRLKRNQGQPNFFHPGCQKHQSPWKRRKTYDEEKD